MNDSTRKLLLFVFLFALIPGVLFASGTIKGVVKDAQTGETLPGANVLIKSIYHGTSTDISGDFVLAGVPDGQQVVTISYLGYVDQDITLNISDGQTETIEISLQVLTIQGEEVVITAQAYGQRAAINQQMAANTVVNVVSGEKIQELPDANAAEAIGRLPGISLKRSGGEANKVVIRGLSPKYNNVMVEGIKMSSTSDFDRSVDLSLVQSESLAGIEVSKSLRPDMDADALGGTINLRLQEAKSGFHFGGAAEGGYANISQNFANYKFNGNISNRFFDDHFGVSLKASYEQKQLPSNQFRAGYTGADWEQTLDETGSFVIDSTLIRFTQTTTLTDRQVTRHRTNGTLILDYKNDWWEAKFFNLLSIKNDDVINRANQYRFDANNNPEKFRLTTSAADWKTYTRTHTFQNTFRYGGSKLDVNLSTTYAEVNMNDQAFPFIDITQFGLNRNLLKNRNPAVIMGMVGGADSLDINQSYLQEFGKTNQKLTDRGYDARIDYEWSFATGGILSGKIQAGGKYHKLDRTSDGTSRYSSFEWGGSVARRQDFLGIFPWVSTDLNASRGFSAINFQDVNYDPGEFLNGRYDLGWGADVNQLMGMQDEYYGLKEKTNYFLRGAESYQRDYEASEELMAGYIMTELNIGSKLMLLPGVRYEAVNTEYFAYQVISNSGITGIEPNPKSVITNRENAKWFPSLNLKYKATDWFTVQGAAYASTTRPSFRQISPYVLYSTTSTNITSNNPFLEPATAWNYDLGVSVMKPKVGLLTVYGFYKVIDDLIFSMPYRPAKYGDIVGGPADLDDRLLGPDYYNEAYLVESSETNLPINNPEKAFVYGIELSWQTNFWYLPGALSGLVLDVNFTLLNTRTQYPYFQRVTTGWDSSTFIPTELVGQEYETREGHMADQPSSIANVILGWDFKGFSARVSYRFQSQTVEGLDARHSFSDRYYDTFSLVDVMLKQKISKNVSCYVNLTNISNHIDDYYFHAQPGVPQLPTRAEYYGFRAQLGVKVRF
jgi:TonB-dependent receptor